MLRPDGYVKVLDFGLAKLTEQEEPTATAHFADKVDVSSGLVMGTVKYMSPEQAQGEQVDPRSDIFSFGVVLYEMLAGRAPFEGKTANELIAAILKREPPPLTDAPEEVRRLIAKVLRKKKEERYQTIEELLVDLKSFKEDKTVTSVSAQTTARKRDGSALATSETAAISTATTLEYVVSGIKRHKTSSAVVVASLAIVALGTMFGLNRLGGRLRAPSREIKITRIPNTDKAVHVAISPNGEYIAYAEMIGGKPGAEQSLWVLQVATNNRAQIVPPAHIDYGSLTYSRDGGEIDYVSNNVLYRIPAGGGEATKLLSDVLGTVSFAPDGRQLAFLRELNSEEMALLVANVDGSSERVLATRKRPEFLGGPTWSPDGSLIACWTGVIAKNRDRSVIGFEETTGEEKRITDHKWEIPYPAGEAHRVTSDPNYNYLDLSLTADSKNLVALEFAFRSSLWLMSNGGPSAAIPITSGEHDIYRHVSWTPDGKILYASNVGSSRDIWIMNGDGTNPKQLTTNAGVNLQANVSSEGRHIVFSSNRANSGAYNIWRMDIDGSNPVQLTRGSGEGQPVCSPDGRWVVYSQGGPNTTPEQKTLWKVSIDGGEPVQLSDRPSSGAANSPDGTLIACWYKADPASPSKIALIPFAGGPPIKILDANRTTIAPVRWTPDGQEVSYIKRSESVSNVWSQPISGSPSKQITQFTSEQIEGFDWSRDGRLVCSRGHNVQDVVLITDFR